MRAHKITAAISIILTIASIILVVSRGLNFGIDFAGGILIEARFEDATITTSQIRSVLSGEIKELQIQRIRGESNDYFDALIRVNKNNEEQSKTVSHLQGILNDNFPSISYRKIDYVGPQIGGELIKKGLAALILSFLFIMIYIWVRFDWQFGLGAIITLIHDAIITIGFFSLTQIEFNTTSIAAILTVIGYSVNDSVVIYDRIRENLRRFKKMPLDEIINSSLNSTLSRTTLTSGFTLLSLLALIIYGGDVLFSFSVATFFGILFGTYSSIYISSPILLYLDPRKKKEND